MTRRRVPGRARAAALAGVLLAVAAPVAGQDPAPARPGRGSPTGVHAEASAVALTGGAGGLGGGLGVRGAVAGQRLALRLKVAADLDGFPDSGGGQEITRFSLSWAPAEGLGPLPGWLAVGPSFVRFEECPGDEDPAPAPCRTVGLAAEVEWGRRVRGIGIGGHAFADLNARAPLVGVALDLRVGWLR